MGPESARAGQGEAGAERRTGACARGVCSPRGARARRTRTGGARVRVAPGHAQCGHARRLVPRTRVPQAVCVSTRTHRGHTYRPVHADTCTTGGTHVRWYAYHGHAHRYARPHRTRAGDTKRASASLIPLRVGGSPVSPPQSWGGPTGFSSLLSLSLLLSDAERAESPLERSRAQKPTHRQSPSAMSAGGLIARRGPRGASHENPSLSSVPTYRQSLEEQATGVSRAGRVPP
jgi:hypothetical protein